MFTPRPYPRVILIDAASHCLLRSFRLRPLLLVTALTLAVATPLASSQESRLPDIGSSAGELLTPAKQAEYGGMLLRELRNYGYLLEDPLITDWLQTMGNQLAADSDNPQQPF